MNDAALSIAPLSRTHERGGFDCGVSALTDYFKKYALQNQKKNAARTYVALCGEKIAGYYTLSFGSVAHDETPPPIHEGMPRYPIPILLLARLAVDVTMQGRGLGAGLLKDALQRALNAAEIGGLRAVMVHAKDDAAKRFYEKFGFAPSPHSPLHLFLTVAQIEAALS